MRQTHLSFFWISLSFNEFFVFFFSFSWRTQGHTRNEIRIFFKKKKIKEIGMKNNFSFHPKEESANDQKKKISIKCSSMFFLDEI